MHSTSVVLNAISITFMVVFFFFNDTATTEIYTLSLHDALPIYAVPGAGPLAGIAAGLESARHDLVAVRSEEHTSELQSLAYLVCRLLLEKKKHKQPRPPRLQSNIFIICRRVQKAFIIDVTFQHN